MRPAGGYRGAFFGELWLLAVGARRFIRSDSDGIQHRAALMINPVTGGQPGGERIAQVMRCPVERTVLQVRREAADMYQLRGKNSGQLCAVLMHEAIEPVILARLNELFVTDNLIDKDMINYAFAVRDKLSENQAVMTQIANNTREQAMLGDFPKAIDDAVMDSNDAQQEMMVQYLSNPELAKGFARVVFDLLKGI